ncbi:MAG: hypothetical protein ABSG94_09835, partial [Brevinematales bacterium]
SLTFTVRFEEKENTATANVIASMIANPFINQPLLFYIRFMAITMPQFHQTSLNLQPEYPDFDQL